MQLCVALVHNVETHVHNWNSGTDNESATPEHNAHCLGYFCLARYLYTPGPPHSLQEICCENVNIWSFKYPEQIDVTDNGEIYITITLLKINLIKSLILAFVTFLLVLVLWLDQKIHPEPLLFSSTSSWWSGVNSIAWMRRLIWLKDFDCF